MDSQGECPMIFFAMEPDASLQLGQEYVIMPYSAMQYRDSRGGKDYFAMDVNGTQLRNAPHVAVNNWSAFNDRQMLSNAHQFYQRTQRTTARPIEGGAAQPNEQGKGTRPDANAHRDSAPQPEVAPHSGLTRNLRPLRSLQAQHIPTPPHVPRAADDRPLAHRRIAKSRSRSSTQCPGSNQSPARDNPESTHGAWWTVALDAIHGSSFFAILLPRHESSHEVGFRSHLCRRRNGVSLPSAAFG